MGHLPGKNTQPRLSFPRCSWKRGCTWTNIWGGRGARGMGWAERGTWAARERHTEEGGVGILSGHPARLPLPPWSPHPASGAFVRPARFGTPFQSSLVAMRGLGCGPVLGREQPGQCPGSGDRSWRVGGGAALRRTPVPPWAAGLPPLPTAWAPPNAPSHATGEKEMAVGFRRPSFTPSGPLPPLLVIVTNANNAQ